VNLLCLNFSLIASFINCLNAGSSNQIEFDMMKIIIFDIFKIKKIKKHMSYMWTCRGPVLVSSRPVFTSPVKGLATGQIQYERETVTKLIFFPRRCNVASEASQSLPRIYPLSIKTFSTHLSWHHKPSFSRFFL